MQEFVALAGIIGALAVGVVSPGPSFVMVARLAVATSRASGLGAAVGMGMGGVVFAVTALFGLQAILLLPYPLPTWCSSCSVACTFATWVCAFFWRPRYR
jgi:threonine/homoserine/homoserine lactone efflux protein